MNLDKTISVLRIFDENKAKEFYVDFLGFDIDFEHRFKAGSPLYMGISRDHCVIHLTEHHGDCCPGSALRIETTDVESYQKELIEKNYKYYRPGIEKTPWGSKDMSVTDPFGNKLTFTSTNDA